MTRLATCSGTHPLKAGSSDFDATGTAEELGKTPGKDEAAGKVTYVSLYGLERARDLADAARARVTAELEALPADTGALEALVAAIRERRA